MAKPFASHPDYYPNSYLMKPTAPNLAKFCDDLTLPEAVRRSRSGGRHEHLGLPSTGTQASSRLRPLPMICLSFVINPFGCGFRTELNWVKVGLAMAAWPLYATGLSLALDLDSPFTESHCRQSVL